MTNEDAIYVLKNAAWLGTIHDEQAITKAVQMAIEALRKQDSALDQWCTDCKEYDHEKHNCPRFNRVIRTALSELPSAEPERRDCGWTCIEDDYPVSIREVIDITAETGALTTQSRVMELKPYKLPERQIGRWIAHDLSIKDAPTECCSECYEWSYGWYEKYCPKCGSPMEVEHE